MGYGFFRPFTPSKDDKQPNITKQLTTLVDLWLGVMVEFHPRTSLHELQNSLSWDLSDSTSWVKTSPGKTLRLSASTGMEGQHENTKYTAYETVHNSLSCVISVTSWIHFCINHGLVIPFPGHPRRAHFADPPSSHWCCTKPDSAMRVGFDLLGSTKISQGGIAMACYGQYWEFTWSALLIGISGRHWAASVYHRFGLRELFRKPRHSTMKTIENGAPALASLSSFSPNFSQASAWNWPNFEHQVLNWQCQLSWLSWCSIVSPWYQDVSSRPMTSTDPFANIIKWSRSPLESYKFHGQQGTAQIAHTVDVGNTDTGVAPCKGRL